MTGRWRRWTRLFLGGTTFFTLGEFSRQYAMYGLQTRPRALPLAHLIASFTYWSWFPAIIFTIAVTMQPASLALWLHPVENQ